MTPESEALKKALVESYPRYVETRVHDLPAAVIESGAEWLRSELTQLLDKPFRQQRRGPLEVFQEAMTFPTEWLQSRGVEPPARDPAKASAMPGDIYDLAPASSQAMGEDVWRLHLVWGARKAAAITRPSEGTDQTG